MTFSHLVAGEPDDAMRRYFEVRGHLVKVVTASAAANDLVSETFYPPGMLGTFETTPDREPDLTVVDLDCDPADIRELLRRVASRETPGEYELTRGHRLPRFDGASHSVFTLKDVKSDELAALVRSEGRATLMRPRTGLGERWLTRVLRDVATRLATAEGSLILHSSGFVMDGSAYLVIGDSGAGKSTTAVALSRLLPQAGWIGNDRIHLERVESRYEVTACPLPLAVNKGSLDVMGVTDFATWKPRAGLPPEGSDWDQFCGEDKLKLSCREVTRYLGVRVVPNAPLAGVLLPRIDPEGEYHLEPASPEHVADVVGRNCFSVDDNLYGEDWLKVPVPRRLAPPTVDEFLGHIAELPVLRCSMGDARDLAKLADELPQAVRS
ncbi:hypothetical protein [Streptomyces sp. NPDC005438]|uniref:hypothetical protein n=1 Tax=Streptomyces sp. NPDC005438 TaxID=3156880 RepID=UPI0033A44818